MRSIMIIGAIMLSGCGSITLAPEDSGPSVGVGETRNDSSVNPDASPGPSDLDATLPTTDGSLSRFDGGAPEEMTHLVLDASVEANPPVDAPPSEPPQTCAPATCYPKSDPNHTTCLCRY